MELHWIMSNMAALDDTVFNTRGRYYAVHPYNVCDTSKWDYGI